MLMIMCIFLTFVVVHTQTSTIHTLHNPPHRRHRHRGTDGWKSIRRKHPVEGYDRCLLQGQAEDDDALFLVSGEG